MIISYTILCCVSDEKLLLKENNHKTQSKWSIANYLRKGVLAAYRKTGTRDPSGTLPGPYKTGKPGP